MLTLNMRPYNGEVDLQPICDLLNTCDEVDNLEDNYSIEDLRQEFADPRLNPARDLSLWQDEDGRLLGFGQLWIPAEGEVVDGHLYFRVHPSIRGEIESDIIAWSSEQLRAVGRERGAPVRLQSGVREDFSYGREILERHGFAPIRYFFTMSRPLDEPIPEPQFPDGFTLRHVASDEDVVGWVEIFNLSFIDHWNHHPMTVEARRHFQSDPHYAAERDLIALAPDGTYAACCFCLINHGENVRNQRNDGWIVVLGTRRGYRKLGLGRAMLLAGMRRLKQDGVSIAKLGVDAENPSGALRLYESVGFHRTLTWMRYSKDL